ncbi:hypothetical protein DZ771_01440 [Enterococcus faecium]|nr:hypothetical protein [Enterococcus faecium]EGP5325180.1 hypothetical protein [Enterococcus faecium]EGP5491970.1 hypothetical protein [Enterococcus faecium]EGP5508111.1 hypothetical protein [Enterococcus faecium]EGP5689556.1 hypothetical protein [Enterococcus faecium]
MWQKRAASRNKKAFTKIASQFFLKFRLIFRRSYFWNTVYLKKGGLTLVVSDLLFSFIVSI